jgi:hypothetical protein
MTITVRSLADSPDSYLASAAGPYGTSSFLLHFRADVFGAMSLHEFADMLRKHYGLPEVDLTFRDSRLQLQDGSLLSLLQEHE